MLAQPFSCRPRCSAQSLCSVGEPKPEIARLVFDQIESSSSPISVTLVTKMAHSAVVPPEVDLCLGRVNLLPGPQNANNNNTIRKNQTSRQSSRKSAASMVVVALFAALVCLLVSTSSTHSQALANSDLLGQSRQPLHFLLYHNKAPSNGARSRPLTGDEVRLLTDVDHDHMSPRVNITLARDIWQRMHENALEFAQTKTDQVRPIVGQFLHLSNVSSQCKLAIDDILMHISRLDEWAMQMYNSFGDLPANSFFEGTMTSMGSYQQCVQVAPNQWIERPQFCYYKFQPIIPKRKRYHNILETIDERLANFTRQEDMFRGFAKKAQYFYYTKMRLATCMPTKCSKSDLDLIGEQIALNTYLQYQGTECLEKETGFNPDGAQVFAMVVLCALASVSLLGTLVHVLNVKAMLAPAHRRRVGGSPLSSVPIELAMAAKLKAADKQQLTSARVVAMADHESDLENNNNNNIAQHQVPRKDAAAHLTSPISDISMSASSSERRKRSRLVRVVDILLHFSVIRNGRKLFDTSTSAGRGSTRTSSLMAAAGKCDSAANVRNGVVQPSNRAPLDGSVRSDLSSVESQSKDISCVHGLRFWTISWIILGHTMQYTEWSGFARAYQVESNITSFLLHPLLNATFSVDTFFLISGLLTTYVTWTITRGHYWRFNKFAFLISRYLRLMPQVLIVILIFIVFPMLGEGPWWRGVVQKESDRCKENWWVSALFLQSFYRSDKICNLVTWWLSIEMFYHFTSIFVIIALLHSARKGVLTAILLGGSMTVYSCYLHYVNLYPPNMMPTLLQRYEIWHEIVLKYFWTPYPHAPSYFTGLLLGYVLYNRTVTQLTRLQVRLGWCFFVVSYASILFGTYSWNLNSPYSQVSSTAYYNLAQIFWSLATGWAIFACALGEGGWLNEFLSSPVFIPLGRATYMTYLSHMLIVMSYPAKMHQLIEPSYMIFLYIFISNLVLSYALGICLTLVYESPILHLQKLLVARMASKFNDDPRMHQDRVSDDEKAVRVSLCNQPQSQAQQNLDTQFQTTNITTSVCH